MAQPFLIETSPLRRVWWEAHASKLQTFGFEFDGQGSLFIFQIDMSGQNITPSRWAFEVFKVR